MKLSDVWHNLSLGRVIQKAYKGANLYATTIESDKDQPSFLPNAQIHKDIDCFEF